MPVFLDETFSARKRTPFRAHYTPRSPAKSCPPVSRIFRSPELLNGAPHFVSFKSERKTSAVASPHYQPSSHRSYFEQCFDVIEKLGEGSFGEVFKVRSRDDRRLYAVKRSRERFRGSWDRRQKLEEVEKHEGLPAHPNCLVFLNAWEERGHLYIQTELCQMSLSQFADLYGRVPEARVWEILVDLLQGLAHLHSHQLCHFDIKPPNIFVSGDGSCKLGDFGLCISLDQGTGNAMEGDAKYMARELMSRQFSKAADIFSLGISMLEIACDLELPSGGHNWHWLRDGVLPHEFTKDLSPQLILLLSQMMHPQPEERPTAGEVLRHWRVRKAVWRAHSSKAARRMVLVVLWVVSPLYRIVLLLLSLLNCLLSWKVKRVKEEGVGAEVVPSSSPCSSSLDLPFIRAADDSFSDDESGDALAKTCLATSTSEDRSRQKTQLNSSWVSTSPARYPGSFYSGPPIPLNLEEVDFSADECDNASPSNKCPSVPSSQNSSFSCTPNSKPSLDEQVVLRSANRSLNIGPKNLMEMFGDVGD